MSYELHRGDCLQVMQELPPDCCDMVLADPPYGITRNAWDKEIIPLQPMWDCIHRVVRPGGAVVLFGAQPYFSQLVLSNLREWRYELIWCKPQGSDFLNANRKPLRAHEDVGVWCDRAPRYHPVYDEGAPYKAINDPKRSCNWGEFEVHCTDNAGTRCPKTWRLVAPERGLHPTRKPAALLEWLLQLYSDSGDTVLDFCMGSGSTGAACINTGRNFIGIEKDEKYFSIAKDRLDSITNSI